MCDDSLTLFSETEANLKTAKMDGEIGHENTSQWLIYAYVPLCLKLVRFMSKQKMCSQKVL